MTKIQNVWIIIAITLVLSACGGPTLTKLPPAYEEPVSSTSSKKPSVSSSTSQSLPPSNVPSPESPAEVVVPKAEPIHPGTAKSYRVLGETYTPMKEVTSFMQKGHASWYGKKFHGRKTANGEIYNMYKLSAAHKTLPIPSYVKVTNEHNQKSIIVRVNDRGPFVKGRIIDLSYAAAKELDMVALGTVPVTIELVDPNNPESVEPSEQLEQVDETLAEKRYIELPTDVRTTSATIQTDTEKNKDVTSVTLTSIVGVKGSFVQVGAFKSEQNADGLHQRISSADIAQGANVNKVYNGNVYQVVLGPYAEYDTAKQVSTEVRDQLQLSSMVFSQ